jgi:hypothetical protein
MEYAVFIIRPSGEGGGFYRFRKDVFQITMGERARSIIFIITGHNKKDKAHAVRWMAVYQPLRALLIISIIVSCTTREGAVEQLALTIVKTIRTYCHSHPAYIDFLRSG